MINPPPATAGRECAVSELDGVGSRLGGVALLGDALTVRESLQDAQNLGTVATLAEQGEGKVKAHGLFESVWFGVGVFQGAPAPIVSGSDQQVILPAGKLQNLIMGAGGRFVCFHDSSAALSGNLINAQGTVGCGVVAHGSFAVDLLSVRGQGVGGDPQCASASGGIVGNEVLQELPCLIAAHLGDHLTGDGLPGEIVCQVNDGGPCLRGGEFGGSDLSVGHGRFACELRVL